MILYGEAYLIQVITGNTLNKALNYIAARMSSRPMGWSIDGADKMARLRAFKANKGSVIDFLRTQEKEKKLYTVTKKLMKQVQAGLKAKTNEKLHNIEVFNQGKITWEYKWLKSLC
jgi:hypothetical protein